MSECDHYPIATKWSLIGEVVGLDNRRYSIYQCPHCLEFHLVRIYDSRYSMGSNQPHAMWQHPSGALIQTNEKGNVIHNDKYTADPSGRKRAGMDKQRKFI